jgi:hypothetical protein
MDWWTLPPPLPLKLWPFSLLLTVAAVIALALAFAL